MKCVIIEDERPAQKLLQNYIGKTPKLELIATFDSALQVDIPTISLCDLLFLDIKLPQVSGLTFLQTLPVRPEIIITTAFPNYAVEAFELEMADYLVKPFSFERFLKAVNRAENLYCLKRNAPVNFNRNYFFIYSDKIFYRIETDEILFLKGEGDYISLHTTRKKWMLNDSLKNWLKKLPNEQFVQVHQSYIINKDRIDKVQSNRVFIAEHKIPVSRNHKQKLIAHISDKHR